MSRRALVVPAITLVILLLGIAPSLAVGATTNILPTIVPQSCNQPGGCQSVCDIAQIAQNILNLAIYVAVFLSAVLFAWAGLMYLTSVANPSGITKAKDVFFYVAMGLIIILAGWLVVDTVMKVLVNQGNFGPWNKIC